MRLELLALAGAALLAGCLGPGAAPRGTVIEADSPAIGPDGTLVQALGIETLGGTFTPMLATGRPVPCETSQIFSTATDDQAQIAIHLLRGSGPTAIGATSLGRFQISGFAPAPRGLPQIQVLFRAAGRALVVVITDLATGTELPFTRVGRDTPATEEPTP